MKVKWRQVKRKKAKIHQKADFLVKYQRDQNKEDYAKALYQFIEYGVGIIAWDKALVDVRFDDYTPPDPNKSYKREVKVVEVKKGEAPRYED